MGNYSGPYIRVASIHLAKGMVIEELLRAAIAGICLCSTNGDVLVDTSVFVQEYSLPLLRKL